MRENFYKQYTQRIVKNRRFIMILLVLIMAGAVFGLIRIKIDTDFQVFMPKESQYIKNLTTIEEEFGGGSQLLLLLNIGKEGLTYRTYQELLSLQEDLLELEELKKLQSPIPESIPVEGEQIPAEKIKEKQFGAVQAFLENLPTEHGFAEEDGNHYVIMQVYRQEKTTSKSFFSSVKNITAEYPYSYHFSGEPYLEAKVFDYILRIILILPPGALILMLIIFRLRIGSWKATVISLFPAGVGALLTLGIVGWIMGSISLVTVIVPIFIIVMGSADGLHFSSHLLDALDEGRDRKSAVEETLRAVGIPMIMTTITTMIGFLSMLFIRSDAMRNMGITAALGVFIAGSATWIFLPVILYMVPNITRKKKGTGASLPGIIRGLQGKRAYWLAGGILLAVLPGIFLIRANFNMLSFYKSSTDVRESIEKVNDVFGGSMPVSVAFSAASSNIFSPETAEKVIKLEEKLRERGICSNTVSIYDIITGVMGSLSSEPSYPGSTMQAQMAASMIEKRQSEIYSQFVNTETGRGRMTAFLRDINNETLDAFEKTVNEYQDNFEFLIAGVPFAMKSMNEQIIPQQINSLIFAALIVFVLVSLMNRNLKIGAVTIVPIIITLAALFGTMGYAGIDLSIVTGIMSGLTIGVGIDYAIHYVSLFRYYRRKGEKNPAEKALRYVASPVLANALGLAVGFSVMNLSPLQIHTYLSILMWVAMVVSALLSLTLIPAMLGQKGNSGKPGA